jgi:hypothetical protein
MDVPGPLADDGMSIGGAITAMQTHGACMEADWPYDLNHVNKKPNDDCFKAAQRFKVGRKFRKLRRFKGRKVDLPCDQGLNMFKWVATRAMFDNPCSGS